MDNFDSKIHQVLAERWPSILSAADGDEAKAQIRLAQALTAATLRKPQTNDELKKATAAALAEMDSKFVEAVDNFSTDHGATKETQWRKEVVCLFCWLVDCCFLLLD